MKDTCLTFCRYPSCIWHAALPALCSVLSVGVWVWWYVWVPVVRLGVRCREGTFSYEDAVRLGQDAGQELKQQAGPEFFSW